MISNTCKKTAISPSLTVVSLLVVDVVVVDDVVGFALISTISIKHKV